MIVLDGEICTKHDNGVTASEAKSGDALEFGFETIPNWDARERLRF